MAADVPGFLGPGSIWLGVGNPVTARLALRAGAHGLWVSGYCASAEARGVADMSLLAGVEMIDLARRVCLAADETPVVLDCDSGFGDENIWRHSLEEIARSTNVAAVCIEDKAFPKRNSFYRQEQVLRDIDESAEFIRIAVRVRDAHRPSLRVIARTEALIAGGTPDDAADRLAAYELAGADAFLIQARGSEAELVDAIGLAVGPNRPPVVLAPSAYPDRSPAYWWSVGAAVVIHANQLLRLGLAAQERALAGLLSPEITPRSLAAQMWTMEQLNELVARPTLQEVRK